MLDRLTEKYGWYIDYHPKPLGKELDWNGSGMHANFSNSILRTCGSKGLMRKFVKRSDQLLKNTSLFTVSLMINV